MFRWLIRKIFGRRQDNPEGQFKTRALAYPFCTFAILFFGFQVIVVTMGAVELIWPNMPAPVPFRSGRMVHLNLSVFWPLIAAMGSVFYFFPKEAKTELNHLTTVRMLSYLFPLVLAAILTSFVFGLTEGREYLEAIRPFDWAVTFVLLLFSFVLTTTYLKKGVPKFRATLLGMLAGSWSLVLLYLPNMLFYAHPSVDEAVKFWIVHIWEEMSMELFVASVIAAFLLSVTSKHRKATETILLLELSFISVTGFFATSHHYYWIGTPSSWLWIGGIFSTLQVLPSLLLIYVNVKDFKKEEINSLSSAEKMAFGFIFASLFYHAMGAGMLGWILALPFANRYVHGTYLTSSHAHFALFGAFGFFALGFAVYILTKELNASPKDYFRLWISYILLNLGLMIMGVALAIAGTLQGYLWRVLGNDFMHTQELILPYLIIRVGGGVIFTGGGVILAWTIAKLAWRNKRKILFLS